MRMDTPVSQLKTVGQALGGRLKRLGIETAKDLLLYFPFRYEDFSQTKAIAELVEGEDVTVLATVELIANKRSHRKRRMITEALVSDGEEQLRIVWWGQPYIAKNLKAGDQVYFSGKVSTDMFGPLMKSPGYEKKRRTETVHTARIVPIYSLTAGVTQKQLRFLVSQVIDLADQCEEWLSDDVRDQADVMPYAEAIRTIHFPETHGALAHARRRLKFDELFTLQLRARAMREEIEAYASVQIPFQQSVVKSFVDELPFTLTDAQRAAAWEILQDLEKGVPMNRLLEGDVGSGKTVVAALVMRNVVAGNAQSVMMAPTEILAVQHFESLKETLDDSLKIGLLSRSHLEVHGFDLEEKTKAGRRREFLAAVQSGMLDVVVGTHALLNDDVSFKNLGLVIVDEQHRFGVEQRRKLRTMSGNTNTQPHFLSMTATPIPRSFALTIYGDLDLSIISQMPKGRKPIKTRVVEPKHRQKAYQFIRAQVNVGRQVFVICPMIDAGTSEKKSVMQEYEKLSEDIFPDLSVAYLHGKMSAKEKDKTMDAFASGKTNILVSTSVVEVGVNIPNATVMMIEGAERFGLAQLHQFRGRVGRSDHQSFCFLFTESSSDFVKERLAFFESHTDGFAVAEYDLAMRGPGDVYGKAQSGLMQLQFATMQDVELIKLARDVAKDISFEKEPLLKKRLKDFEATVHME